MGRAPCCDKANVKKGPWSPEEDAKLKSYIEQHGTGGNWIALPQKIGLKRCGKSCRLRWLNYLRPNIKHGGFSEEEDNIICSLYISIGSRWSVIAAQLPGRTDNDIKNYWNTRLKKKLLGKHRKEQQQARNNNRGSGVAKQGIISNNGGSSGDSSSSSLLVPENSAQQPYWPPHIMPVLPAAPVPYTSHQLGPSFNDQDSIRKLLIKLGGRFSDDYQPTLEGLVNNLDHQFPNCPPPTQNVYEEQVHIGSSSCTDSISNNVVQFSETNNQYCSEGLELVQGQDNFTAAIGEMVAAANYPRRVDGMEFFYGEELVSDKIIGTTATSTPSSCSQATNWGETSTMIYPPLVSSNYREETPQECVFQEYYPGPQ